MKRVNKSIFASTLCITGTMIFCTIIDKIILVETIVNTNNTSFFNKIMNIGNKNLLILYIISLILIILGIILFIDNFLLYINDKINKKE